MCPCVGIALPGSSHVGRGKRGAHPNVLMDGASPDPREVAGSCRLCADD